MVSTLIPEEKIGSELKKSLGEDRPFPEVEWTEHIRPHPFMRGRPRIRLGAEINHMQRPATGLVNILPDDLAIIVNTEMEGIHLAYDTTQSILEYNYVQSAINLQVFT